MSQSKTISDVVEATQSTILSDIASIGTMGAFVVAVIVFVVDMNRRRNDLLRAQAIISLERAWEVFSEGNPHAEMPVTDRLVWLTTARHLLSYRKLRSRMLFAATVSRALDDHEQYWRYRFYLILRPIRFNLSFYLNGLEPGKDEQRIEPRSAFVITEFSNWPAGLKDELENVVASAKSERIGLHAALQNYLEKVTIPESDSRGKERLTFWRKR